jgi:hypothetical protein
VSSEDSSKHQGLRLSSLHHSKPINTSYHTLGKISNLIQALIVIRWRLSRNRLVTTGSKAQLHLFGGYKRQKSYRR